MGPSTDLLIQMARLGLDGQTVLIVSWHSSLVFSVQNIQLTKRRQADQAVSAQPSPTFSIARAARSSLQARAKPSWTRCYLRLREGGCCGTSAISAIMALWRGL